MVVAMAMTSCEKTDDGVLSNPYPKSEVRKPLTTRSYAEALDLAEESIALVDRGTTRAISPRRIIGRGQCVTAPSKTRSGATDTLIYVFNFADNAGFSAIAANRAIEQPILAVTEKGNYTYGEPTGVDNFDYYMEEMVKAVAVIPPFIPVVPPDSVGMMIRTDTIRGFRLYHEPVLTVNWGQEGVFGEYFDNGVCGCVITAVAQIMSYHEHPSSITTVYPDSIPYSGQIVNLNWLMMKAYPEPISIPYQYKISALCKDVGVRVGAHATSSISTGASSYRVPSCLNAYGYTTNNVQSVIGNEAAMRMDLNLGYPVYMDGSRYDENGTRLGGHAWVADGVEYQQITYKDYEWDFETEEYVLVGTRDATQNMIHINWGWDGTYNGPFALLSSIPLPNGRVYENLGMIRAIRVE